MGKEEKITFEELLKYAKRTIAVMHDEYGKIKPEYNELIEKVSNALKKDDNLAEIAAELRVAESPFIIEELRDRFEKIQKEEFERKSDEEKISETYGISLDSIEHIRLRSGEEYYKFYDAKTNRDIILSQNDKDKNLSEEFEDVQNNISGAHGEDALQNGEDIFKYQRMHTNNEVHMYTVQELENNPTLLGNLDGEQLKALSTILKNKDKLKISYINPMTGLALDEEHKVITAELDKNKEKYEIMYPQEYGYEDQVDSVDKDNPEVQNDLGSAESLTINDNQEQTVVEQFYSNKLDDDMTEDVDDPENQEEVNPEEKDEEIIDPDRVRMYYEYPELFDKDTTLTPEEKMKYMKAVEKHNETVENERVKNDPPKVLIKKKPKLTTINGGYADVLLLALATGYFGGIITMVVYSIINH